MSGMHEFEERRARAVMNGRLTYDRAVFEIGGYFMCTQSAAEKKLDQWIDILTRADLAGPVMPWTPEREVTA